MSLSTLEWYNELKKLTRGMPPIDATPDVEMPEEDPPQLDEKIADMDDDRLSSAYHLVSQWKAYCDFAVGVYAAAEVAYSQRVDDVKRQVYMEKFSTMKPRNVKEGEMYVDQDPRVKKEVEMHNTMKQGHIMYKSKAQSFQQLAMTYGNERKDRRERELRSSWDD